MLLNYILLKYILLHMLLNYLCIKDSQTLPLYQATLLLVDSTR